VVWEKRTTLVKQQIAAETAASNAKTARLKALRLAKEETDRATCKSKENAPKLSRR
jgi:hypothetical protein